MLSNEGLPAWDIPSAWKQKGRKTAWMDESCSFRFLNKLGCPGRVTTLSQRSPTVFLWHRKKKPGADSRSQNAVIAQVCGHDMAHKECGWVLKLKDGMVISRKIG